MKHYVLKFSLACLLVLSIAPRFTFAENHQLLVVGDSISSAYGMAIDDGWVALLQERINTQGLDIKVINASITGDLTGSGQNRIGALLKQYQPKWVLIELGGNDGLRGLPIKPIQRNLQSMVEQSLTARSQPIIIPMQIFPNYGPKYTAAFKNVFYDVAQSSNVPILPFILDGVGGIAGMNQADGIHPSKLAQPLLLDNLWDSLLPLLQ